MWNYGRTHGAPFRGYGYVPLRNGGNVVRRMGTQQNYVEFRKTDWTSPSYRDLIFRVDFNPHVKREFTVLPENNIIFQKGHFTGKPVYYISLLDCY